MVSASSSLSALRRSALAAATVTALGAQAQDTAALQTITVTGRSASNSAGIAGFGDIPLARSPYSATVITTAQMQDAGIASLADITRLDAALTDAYNAPGYWGQLAARGFTLDNRFNYRRDGLPINAETVLPTGNKSALELLKGTSGIQAGTSAPGGLVNLVVKRPTAQALRNVSLEWTQPGTVAVDADIGDRAGADGAFGWRVNLGAARLDPMTRSSRGESHLVAGAIEWRLGNRQRLELELEDNRQSQPSTPGFSLLGNRLPSAEATDPRLNLNNQAWSLPVVLQGRTGSIRYAAQLAERTELVAHLMRQRLTSDDRVAFPFGCSSEDDYTRYCGDGSFDLYDYRSEGERRATTAGDLSIKGQAATGGVQHRWQAGLLATRYAARFNRQAYNWVGVGRIDGSVQLPSDPTLTDENTQRDERSTELHLQNVADLALGWQWWAGVRHTRLDRKSVRTDGGRATRYEQSFTTPSIALAWQLDPSHLVYASYGRGIESDVAPNRARYTNAGQALPALQSRQFELGIKLRSESMQASFAAFDIERPVWSDLRDPSGLSGSVSGGCSDADPCTRRADGRARHRGIEAEAEWRAGALSLRGSVSALRARREGSAEPALNGMQPTNVPKQAVKMQAAYNLSTLPGLALLGFVSHEGPRAVLPDNSVFTSGWTRVDLGLRYAVPAGGGAASRWVWRAGIDNLLDRRAWKETPYQFDHAYLYPLAPRTWRLALHVSM